MILSSKYFISSTRESAKGRECSLYLASRVNFYVRQESRNGFRDFFLGNSTSSSLRVNIISQELRDSQYYLLLGHLTRMAKESLWRMNYFTNFWKNPHCIIIIFCNIIVWIISTKFFHNCANNKINFATSDRRKLLEKFGEIYTV